MFIELYPGRRQRRSCRPGSRFPSPTRPPTSTSTKSCPRSTPTRAYLSLLVNGAGQGLKGNGGNELAQVLERFEPTHRDLARVSTAIALRATHLRRLINSLQRLNTAVAAKQGQVTQLVDSSATVFRAFASEDRNVSAAVAELPGTLRQTTGDARSGPGVRDAAWAGRHQPVAGGAGAAGANAALTALSAPSAPIVRTHSVRS